MKDYAKAVPECLAEFSKALNTALKGRKLMVTDTLPRKPIHLTVSCDLERLTPDMARKCGRAMAKGIKDRGLSSFSRLEKPHNAGSFFSSDGIPVRFVYQYEPFPYPGTTTHWPARFDVVGAA